MAIAAKAAKAAAGASISKTPLTKVQREQRSIRTTYKHREKYRQATSYVKGAVNQATLREAARLRRENIDAQTKAYQQRNLDRSAVAIARRKQYNQIQTRENVKRQLVTEPAVGVVAPAARSGFMLMGLFFLLIIFYAIVTNPSGTTGWLNGLTSFMRTFSQNGSLFTKTTTGSK